MGSVYRYTFDTSIPSQEIEATLVLALLGTELLHGAPLTRLDAGHCFDAQQRICVLDGATEAGQHFSRLFTGYLSREFGPDLFAVERLDSAAASPAEELTNVQGN